MKVLNILAVSAFVSLSGSALMASAHGICTINGKADATKMDEKSCTDAHGKWTPSTPTDTKK